MSPRHSTNGSARREKALVLGGVALLLFLLLAGRLFLLQVVSGDRYRSLSEANWLRPESLPGQRGRILDRNGRVLADVIPSFTVVIDLQDERLLREPALRDTALVRLAAWTGREVEELRRVCDRHRGYSYHPVRLVRNVDLPLVTRIEENRSRVPGVSVEPEPFRYYPHDSLAAHVLGYVREVSAEDLERLSGEGYRQGSVIGRAGVERQYKSLLRGRDGLRYIEVSAIGRRSEAFLEAQPVPPTAGSDIRLTLDLDLQIVLEAALDSAGYDGEGGVPPDEVSGAGIVLDVVTGDILAMASRPRFDPNLFSSGFNRSEWAWLNRDTRPQYHRAVLGRYPPASTFKGLTLYAALDRGLVGPRDTPVYCTGGYRFGNRVFRCWRRAGHGRMDARQAMSHSCDSYFYDVGADLGVDGIHEYAARFRMAEPTGVDLPGEPRGLVPDRGWYDEAFGSRGWSNGVALNLSIGQGEIQLTPLQLAVFTGVVATGGRRVVPRLLLQPEPGAPTPPVAEHLVLDPAHLEVVRRGMIDAVVSGTAGAVRFDSLSVAAKTGTAENRGEDHAVFVAYAPVEAPRIAVCVYLENRGHGGAVAGPVARRVLAAHFGIDLSGGVPVPGEGD